MDPLCDSTLVDDTDAEGTLDVDTLAVGVVVAQAEELPLLECDEVIELLLDALGNAVAVPHTVALAELIGVRDTVVDAVDDTDCEEVEDPDGLKDNAGEAESVSETTADALSLIDCVINAVVEGVVEEDSVASGDADAIPVSETLGEVDADKDELPVEVGGGVSVVAAVAVTDALCGDEGVALADTDDETEADTDMSGDIVAAFVGVSNGDVVAESVDEAVAVVEIDPDADCVEDEEAQDDRDGDDEIVKAPVIDVDGLAEPESLAAGVAEYAAVDELEPEMEADSLGVAV